MKPYFYHLTSPNQILNQLFTPTTRKLHLVFGPPLSPKVYPLTSVFKLLKVFFTIFRGAITSRLDNRTLKTFNSKDGSK